MLSTAQRTLWFLHSCVAAGHCSVWLGLNLYLCVMTICLTNGAVCSDDKTVHFLLLLLIFLWFLLLTWCWINAFKRCYTTVDHSPHFGFLRAEPSGRLKGPMPHTNLQSQNAPELAPQIHTVYSWTQLSMVPLWFSNLLKITTVTLLSYGVYYTDLSIHVFILLWFNLH